MAGGTNKANGTLNLEKNNYCWLPEEVQQLIEIRIEINEYFTGRRGSAKSGWNKVADLLEEKIGKRGPNSKQCKKKWENLMYRYKTIITVQTGEVPAHFEGISTDWPYFGILHDFIASRHTANTEFLLDSSEAFETPVTLSLHVAPETTENEPGPTVKVKQNKRSKVQCTQELLELPENVTSEASETPQSSFSKETNDLCKDRKWRSQLSQLLEMPVAIDLHIPSETSQTREGNVGNRECERRKWQQCRCDPDITDCEKLAKAKLELTQLTIEHQKRNEERMELLFQVRLDKEKLERDILHLQLKRLRRESEEEHE